MNISSDPQSKKQYHIGCASGDLPSYLLLPGDPQRVKKISQVWDQSEKVTENREFFSMKGTFKGVDLACLSTGIGASSATIVLEEAARVGVDTFLRVGTTGSLQKGIELGDLVISTGAVRLEGASQDYIFPEYPALASYEVVLALIEACEKMKINYHLGITASQDSFYVGEGREGFGGYTNSKNQELITQLRSARVSNIEMEVAPIFTLANLYGLRAGAICLVVDSFLEDKDKFVVRTEDEKRMGLVASEAIAILANWDQVKKDKKKKYFYPSLIV
ncbi:nucleoside phosphorylase [Patescibacteria group bacterium]|nr:nucleoside phosphorylase [Patescibacteria group bacterium]